MHPVIEERVDSGRTRGDEPPPVVGERDLAPLPITAQRYLRFTGVVGRPRDRSVRLEWKGRFRRSLRAPWMPCEAWQYNTCPDISRDFHLHLRLGGALPLIGRDTYVAGHGRLKIQMFGLFTVADQSGPDLDVGELVTWLDDAVLFAPSMLLHPAVSWLAVDGGAFDLVLEERGHRVARACPLTGTVRRTTSARRTGFARIRPTARAGFARVGQPPSIGGGWSVTGLCPFGPAPFGICRRGTSPTLNSNSCATAWPGMRCLHGVE